jgi:hypothetical protein
MAAIQACSRVTGTPSQPNPNEDLIHAAFAAYRNRRLICVQLWEALLAPEKPTFIRF